eukprot:jgi/Mesvir1/20796/Mv07901-RA.1
MENPTGYLGGTEDGMNAGLPPETNGYEGNSLQVHQLIHICTENQDGVLVEKLVIPRGEIQKFCNASVPSSCNQNASKVHFDKLNRLQHHCYGVVGHRHAILDFLKKTVGLDDKDMASKAPGIYGVSLHPPGMAASTSESIQGAPIWQPSEPSLVLVVLWPVDASFASISPNSITSTCVRYITQLTRHVFFCFDRPGTLAFPSGQATQGEARRISTYHFTQQVIQEDSFSLHPGFDMDASIMTATQGGQPFVASHATHPISQRSIITGSGTLAAILEQSVVASSWSWDEGHTVRFDLTDDAGQPVSSLREKLQQNRVELHTDMPAGERTVFLRALASPGDRGVIDSLLRKLEEERQALAREGEAQIVQLRAKMEATQRGFQQGVVGAFHSMLASQTQYPGALPTHCLAAQEGQPFLSGLGHEASLVVAQLRERVREVENAIQALVGRCCVLGVLAREAKAGGEEAWLKSQMEKSDSYLNSKLAHLGADVGMEAKSWLALGYPFKELSGTMGEGAPSNAGWGWGLGGISRLWGGGKSRAWTPADTRARLAEWARGQFAQVINSHEASLGKEAATGSLCVHRRLDGRKAEVKARMEEACAKAERSCLAQMEQVILSPAPPAAGPSRDDRQVLRVRRCTLNQRSVVQRAASALLGATGGGGVVDQVQVTFDIQQPQEPRLELAVSLISAPRPDDAAPLTGNVSGLRPQFMRGHGRASIPSSWTLLASFLMNKGRWLLTVANNPNERTAVTIHKLTSEGQHFTKSYGKPSLLADFDEATRFLAFHTVSAKGAETGESTAFVYRFNEGFTAMEQAGPPLELSALSGSSELRDMRLLKSQRKLVMLDVKGRVRVYNVQQQAMERETYTAPASAGAFPTSLLTTPTGHFIMLVSRVAHKVTGATSGKASAGQGPSNTAAVPESIHITPLAVPGLHALPQVEATYPGDITASSSLVTFSLALGEQGAVNQYLALLCGDGGQLATLVVKAQGREQAEQIVAVADAGRDGQGGPSKAVELCMLEYVFHAYDKFAVEGAAATVAREVNLRDIGMHLAVVMDPEGAEAAVPGALAACVQRYVDGIERRLKTGYKPMVEALSLSRNLVVLSSAALDDSWLAGVRGVVPAGSSNLSLDSARRLWLSSAAPFQMGSWVKQLICLLPLQIARAEDNAFVLMADGMQLKAHPRSTEEAVGMVSFGLLDAVLESWRGDVVVVSSMGKQSTGKSYTLNHLFGTSFQISGARCTDGCWMGLCQVGSVLYVILDFEGLGSFERTEQEDMLLAVFNAAVSNYTLFKTEFRLDRDLEAMFSRFQSGTGLLKGDERLFKGCFCIVVKDVADRDVVAIKQEFRSKIALITRPTEAGDRNDAPANFISAMFNGEFAIFPFPPLGQPEFYAGFCDLMEAIGRRTRQFTSGGGGFSSFMKHIMAKMVIKDWTSLEGQDVLARVQYLSKHVNAAIAGGRLDTLTLGMEEEFLSCLDTGREVDSLDMKLSVLEAKDEEEGIAIQAPQVPDASVLLRAKGEDQESLIARLRAIFCKGLGPEVDQTRWQPVFVAFVAEVVERRCARVQEWVDVNLSPLKKEGGRLDDCAVRFMDDVASKLQALRNEWQLCGSTCSHCFMTCLLPKSHPAADHTCMGSHACLHPCFFCSEETEDSLPGSPSVHACAEKMGHGGAHCCKDMPHTCQEACSMAGSLNCNSTCCKKAGHERLPGGGSHLCNSPMHLCGKLCSANNCRGRCQINADKTHSVHKCAEVMCLHGCAVKDCTYTCSSRDHFHHTELSQVFKEEQGMKDAGADVDDSADSGGGKRLHFCGREHACPRRCEAEGICRITVQQISEAREELFEGKRSIFTYKAFSEANGHREKCAVRIPPYQLEHEGPHTHSLDPRVVHTCNVRCEDCEYYCELPIKHGEKHKGAHGNMKNSTWITTRKDGAIDFGDRKYVAGESTKAEICDMFCRTAGRGHTHSLPCDAETVEKCTHAHKDGRAHDTRVFFPPRKYPSDRVTHNCYWDTIGWNDNCTAAEREEFAKCRHECPHPQHDEDGQLPSYCEFELWHAEIDGDNAEKRAKEAESPNNTCFGPHVFPCTHTDWEDVFKSWVQRRLEERKKRGEEKKDGSGEEDDLGASDDDIDE